MKAHRLHLYTGNGKGKTTAAMGLALRALGHGQRVLVAQFLKDGRSGELQALRQLSGAVVYESTPIAGFSYEMGDAWREATRKAQTEQARRLKDRIARERPDTVILDELAVAADKGLIEERAARELIAAALDTAETVVTGASAPRWLTEMSDYVSRVCAEKHPYQTEGLTARQGVEW